MVIFSQMAQKCSLRVTDNVNINYASTKAVLLPMAAVLCATQAHLSVHGGPAVGTHREEYKYVYFFP